MKTNKGFATIIIAVIIILLVLGGGVYIYLNKDDGSASIDNAENYLSAENKKEDEGMRGEDVGATEEVVNGETPELKNENISDRKTYKNTERGFSFEYPLKYEASELGGGVTLIVAIDRDPNSTLYFLSQGMADDYSAYDVLSSKKIMIAGMEATERIFIIPGNDKVTLQIEVRTYTLEGFNRSDTFGSEFKNVDEARSGSIEIENIAQTLEYL